MTWLLTLIALLLRLPLLTQSLWLDEAIEALALQGYYGRLSSYALSDFQPPLYHFLLKAWTSLAGYSEIALRLPSLIAGVALVVVTVMLGERLYSRRLGQIAGLLVATNPLLIYYSQEGRTYMLTTLFVALSFYYLLKLLKGPRAKTSSSVFYVLFTALTLWTSYLAWFLVTLELLALVYKKRFGIVRLTLLACLSLIPWVLPFIHSLRLGLADATTSPEWGRVVGGVSGKALILTWVKTVIGRISFSPPWLYGAVASALFFLHVFILSHLTKVPRLVWLWLASLIPCILISFFVPAYSYTRVLFVVPAYLLLLSIGLINLNKSLWTATIVAAQLACLVIFWLTPRFHREDWRALVSYLNSGSGTVMMPSLDQSPPLVYYHLRLPLATSPAPGDTHPIYYLRYAEAIFDPHQRGPASLERAGYTITKELSFTGIPLVVYENSH